MIRVDLDKIIFYPPSKGYAILLKELKGERQLPVIVGVFEAQAIALALERVKMPRPMTHDLVIDLLDHFDISIKRVVIDDLVDGTFYAKINLHDGRVKTNPDTQVDSRPSDAIALALRVDADIFVAEKVMDEAGRLVSVEEIKEKMREKKPSKKKDKLDQLYELKTRLQTAIDEEDYETAAKLRDEITMLEKEMNQN